MLLWGFLSWTSKLAEFKSQNHSIVEWPGLKRTTMIIEFQPSCYVQGCQPPDPAAQSHIQPGNIFYKSKEKKGKLKLVFYLRSSGCCVSTAAIKLHIYWHLTFPRKSPKQLYREKSEQSLFADLHFMISNLDYPHTEVFILCHSHMDWHLMLDQRFLFPAWPTAFRKAPPLKPMSPLEFGWSYQIC